MTSFFRVITTSLCICLCLIGMCAQELSCQVEVNTSLLEGGNRSEFNSLRQLISDYLNTTIFTDATFKPDERIDCRIMLTIDDYSGNNVTGSLQVQSSRPVYGSAYTTTLLNHRDAKIDFPFQEGDHIVLSDNHFDSKLKALLDYYAYLIIAMDFDSFSPCGGDPYFQTLKTIVQQGQSSGDAGWRAFESETNRATLAAAFTDPSASSLRDFIYKYHREGLDQMSATPEKGREAVHNAIIGDLKNVHSAMPMSPGIELIKDSKLDEIINIYSEASHAECREAHALMTEIYPGDGSRIDKIKK